MTEDELIKSLKREPFDVVYKRYINSVWFSDAKQIVINSGWTWSDFEDAQASYRHGWKSKINIEKK